MRRILKFLIFSLILLGGIDIVSAVTTINYINDVAPANDTNYTADVSVDIYSTDMAGGNLYVVANSSAGVLTTLASNTSVGAATAVNFTIGIDVSAVADGAYSVFATANRSLSGETNSSIYLRIGIDDTGPTVTWTALTDTKRGDTTTISGTCTDSDFSYTVCSACTYYQAPGPGNEGDCIGGGCAMTVSGNTITYSYSPSVYGVRSSYIECTDQHSQSTNTSQSTVTIHSRGSGVPTQYAAPSTAVGTSASSGESRNRYILLLAMALVVLAIYLAKK